MKKFFSLLALMLLSVAINVQAAGYKPADQVASPQPGVNYLLGIGELFASYTAGCTATVDDDSYLWQIEEAGDGNYYLKSAATGKYWQDYNFKEDLDGYDIFEYAAFCGTMGDKAGAIKVSLTPTEDGGIVVKSEGTYPNSTHTSFWMSHQGTNLAFDPWGAATWYFYTYTDKSAAETLIEYLTTVPDPDSFVAGTTPGTYDAQAVAAYKAAFDAAQVVDSPEGDDLTDEQVQKLKSDLETTLAAVQKAMIHFQDGYYRFISAFASYAEQQEGAQKAIYDAKDGGLSWKNLDQYDVTMIWNVAYNEATGFYKVTNVGTGNGLNDCSQSARATTTTAAEGNELQFITVGANEEFETAFGLLLSTKSPTNNKYAFYHTGGHSGGAGVQGNIVGWSVEENVLDGSTWLIHSVSQAEVDAAIEKSANQEKQDKLDAELAELLNNASTDFNKAASYIKSETGLITSASQYSSPYSQNDLGNADGGNLADGVLNDNDGSTYWHSFWGGGNVANGVHYLQIEAVNSDDFVIYYKRRSGASNDHLTKMSVYANNTPDGEKEDWTLLAKVDFPYAAPGEELTSTLIEQNGQTYNYYRLYEEATTTNGGRGYWHAAEIQFFPSQLDPESQLGQMCANPANKAIVDALKAAIANAQKVAAGTTTQADVDALKKAYADFQGIFVDPTVLKEAIAAAKTVAAGIVEGTKPGFYEAGAGSALNAAIDNAEKLLNSSFDEASVESTAKSLTDEVENAQGKVIKLQANKWYNIKAPTEEMYETYGWDKSNVSGNQAWFGRYESLYGMAFAVGTLNKTGDITTDDNGTEHENYAQEILSDNASEGMGAYLFSENDLTNTDAAAFRFIPVEEGYAIQNKATGLFLKAAGTSGSVSLSTMPSTFKPDYIGYGEIVFRAFNLNGDAQSALHIQKNYNSLVTWGVYEAGTNSALMIEEVDADDEIGSFTKSTRTGGVYAYVNAVEVTYEDNVYGVMGIYNVDGQTHLALKEMEVVPAGVPYIWTDGEVDNYNEDHADEMTEAKATVTGKTIVTETQVANGLTGTLKANIEAATGNVIINGTTAAATETNNIVAGRAYLNVAACPAITEEEAVQADVDIVISGEVTAIESVMANIAKAGAVYNMNGQLISKKATLKDVKAMGRGMYILNGVKILVK